jgi:hypothetical protein
MFETEYNGNEDGRTGQRLLLRARERKKTTETSSASIYGFASYVFLQRLQESCVMTPSGDHALTTYHHAESKRPLGGQPRGGQTGPGCFDYRYQVSQGA